MLKLLGVTLGMTFGVLAHAVGLGGINVVSSLGQPLKAEIELVDVSKSDKPGLVARLASPDAYAGAGIDYPQGVKYSFQIESRANGVPFLRLSSNKEINDPFVSLLVELSWSSGKLMREYTFLLDPPGYVAIQPKSAPLQPIAPAAPQSTPLPPVQHEAAKPTTVAPVARPVERPAAQRAAQPERHPASQVATGEITVKRGDTLNKIASSIKPDNVSLERMLVVLYRANASQFDGSNMNRIRVGKILRQPDSDALMNVTQSEAIQEIHAQAEDWNAYRQKLAGAASSSRQSETARQAVTGKITSTAADKTPVASESAKEVLRLSKGETPGDKVAGAGHTAQDKHDSAAEEVIAKRKAVDEEKTRAALLESNLKDMQKLAALKTEAAALAETVSQVAAASSVAATVEAASSVAAAASAVPVVRSASAVRAVPPPVVAEEPSFMDSLLASPLLLGVGAAALIALGGLGILLGRRKKAVVEDEPEDIEVVAAATGHLTEPVVPSPDTGDFTVHEEHAEVAQHEEIDPISEADLFLNFGRDEQAIQVLKDALQRSPQNHQVHLKLMTIYADRKDDAAFTKLENQLLASGDEAAIQQAAALSRITRLGTQFAVEDTMLQPNIEDADSATALFARPDFESDGSPVLPPAVAQPDNEEAGNEEAGNEVEQKFVNTDAEQRPEDLETAQHEDLDFDLTASQTMVAQEEALDFDVTSTSPSLSVPDALDFDITSNRSEQAASGQQEEQATSLDDLIFDVTSATNTVADEHEEPDAEVLPEAVEEDKGMEFMLDFPLEEVTEQSATRPPQSVNLADISLDLDMADEHSQDSAHVDKAEVWQEVATKIDLAKAYQEMGDEIGAREILDEVMLDGDEEQKQEAQRIIKQLG